jgi:hypothetical protein
MWELGVFEEGSKVVLGDNLVLARITGVVGVGHNFIKFGVDTLGSSFRNEIPVKRMIVSIPPDIFCLSCSQRFKCSYFPWFLKCYEHGLSAAKDALNHGPTRTHRSHSCM